MYLSKARDLRSVHLVIVCQYLLITRIIQHLLFSLKESLEEIT